MSKITGIVERLRASDEVVKRFPALLEIDPESFARIEEIHQRMVGSKHWKSNDVLQNASLHALRDASEFYSHVVRDGRFAKLLETNPRAAASELGKKVSDEAIDILKNLREVLAGSIAEPGGTVMTPVHVAVAIVVVAVEVTVAVGITVVTVAPPPPPPPDPPPPPGPDPDPGPPPGPDPDPGPGPDPGPDPDPPPPPEDNLWDELELELSEVVIAFERTLIELDRAIERGTAIPQVARGARDLSGKGKL